MNDERSWFQRQVFDTAKFRAVIQDGLAEIESAKPNTCVKTYVGNMAAKQGIESMVRKGWKVQHMSTRTSGWLLKRSNNIVVFERDNS